MNDTNNNPNQDLNPRDSYGYGCFLGIIFGIILGAIFF